MDSSENRRYQVLEALGKGGFGTVYRAELKGSGGFSKPVALKVLNPDVAAATGIVERLRDEARMLGLLRHRAIVHVDGLAFLDGRWTIVMEYVEGASLKTLVEETGKLDPKVALDICAEVAGALDMAFARPTRDGKPLGLLHRDIKPANIQLTPNGEVKLLDFGVARADVAREAETKSVIFGSVPYLAPERYEFADCHQSDIYALAATLFELLTADLLGQASPNPRKHQERVDEGMIRLRRVIDDEDLIAFVAKGLAYEPEDRPDARQFEKRCRELVAKRSGPWLKEWAEDHVPPLLAKRSLEPDTLTGSVLMEASGPSGASATQPLSSLSEPIGSPPGKPPPGKPPPATPWKDDKPQRSRPASGGGIGWTIFRGLLLATVLGVLAVVIVVGTSFAGCAGGCAAILTLAAPTPDTIGDDVTQARGFLGQDPSLAAVEALYDRALLDAEKGTLTIWEYSMFDTDVDSAAKDGTVTASELAALTSQYNRITKD